MDLKAEIPTAYGNVPLEDILRAYEKTKEWAENKKAWLKTEAGKEYNRQKSKEYYERHKGKILEKRATRYETDKDTLLNRAKEYYSLHTEEIKEKNKERKQKVKAQNGEAQKPA